MSTTVDRTKGECPRYRVLVVCNDSDYFLRHRLFVVSYLSSIGVDVAVIVGGAPIPADRVRGWTYFHVPIKRFGFAPIGDLALIAKTARVIWRFKPDAVHLITLKPTVFSGLASVFSHFLHGYPKRVLVTLPGLGRMLSLSKRPGERRYLIGASLTIAALQILARFDHVHFTFETRHDFDFWANRNVVRQQNASIIDGTGVNPNLFYPSNVPHNSSKIKVLFASRLIKSKGVDVFLMMAHDLATRSDVEFVVAGLLDDQDPDAISAEYLKQSKEIRFLGRVEDMPNLLRECDIVCLPTTYGEGIPRILIEAAATGLASITSSHPGCREIVEDGVTGMILPASPDMEMSRELGAAVVRYLETPGLLGEHKQAAYRHFQSREFNQNAIAAQFTVLLGVYSSLK